MSTCLRVRGNTTKSRQMPGLLVICMIGGSDDLRLLVSRFGCL